MRDINHQYQVIHNEIFGLSARKLVKAMVGEQVVCLQKHEDELIALQDKLLDIQVTLNSLPQSELTIRRGKDILFNLLEYITALKKSISYLQKICSTQNSPVSAKSNLNNYKKAYDDAIQHHKNLGSKLNQLLSSF